MSNISARSEELPESRPGVEVEPPSAGCQLHDGSGELVVFGEISCRAAAPAAPAAPGRRVLRLGAAHDTAAVDTLENERGA
ncbi:MAG: hypothetical protein KDA41_05990, partial [Planctomycetales bacterium]|nr:hypothetical protein [Planctomycetales bacterium]